MQMPLFGSTCGLEPKGSDGLDQDRDAWNAAVELLKRSGMGEKSARTFFGRLLSKHRLPARDVMPSIQAAKRCGTMDAQSYLSKALQNRTRPDPALAVDWT